MSLVNYTKVIFFEALGFLQDIRDSRVQLLIQYYYNQYSEDFAAAAGPCLGHWS